MLVDEPKRSNHGNDGEESSDDPSDLGSISVYMKIWGSRYGTYVVCYTARGSLFICEGLEVSTHLEIQYSHAGRVEDPPEEHA